MPFSPIAIVGQGCVLPGALSPDEYWDLLSQGLTAIRPADHGLWRMQHQQIIARPGSNQPERSATDHGGYVTGFESRFDPSGYRLSPSDVLNLEPSAQWLLECSRQALTSCSFSDVAEDRRSLIVGSLGYPSAYQSRRSEEIWLEANGISIDRPFPETPSVVRSSEGNLADLVARCLGIQGAAYTIDAACASSIYAIDLACQALHDHRADFVLAGGSNNSDDLFLHVGFTTLRALSPTGFSRPFSRDADGLIPAHGAALVALKRLDDAVQSGDSILGVIRGIGLSNDGRSGGFLSPSQDGQARAIRTAYDRARLSPADVQFVECHATGTQVGDAVELAALQEVFGAAGSIGIGSHKGNIGHSITVAGAAGLIKLLGMFRHRQFVPSVPTQDWRSEAMESPLRVCDRVEEWTANGPRRAGLSAFGFGGANGHLIVEEWISPSKAPMNEGLSPRLSVRSNGSLAREASRAVDVVIVGACALTGSSRSWDEFVQFLDRPASAAVSTAIDSFRLPARELGFPPRDLEKALPQQVAVMSAVQQALESVTVPLNRTAVFIGTDVEPEIARYGARWRLAELVAEDTRFQGQISDQWLHEAQSALISELEPAGVTGTMPNIPAHRINVKHDMKGPGYTVSAGAMSGIRSLQIAVRSLQLNEIDAAVVGAVDLCCESVHEHLLNSDAHALPVLPGDAAVVFLLKRSADALASGDRVLASINVTESFLPVDEQKGTSLQHEVRARFGHCGAAAGLLEVAVECARVGYLRTARMGFTSPNGAAAHVEIRHAASRVSNVPFKPSNPSNRDVVFTAHLPRVVFQPLTPTTESSEQIAAPPMPTHNPIPNGGLPLAIDPNSISGIHQQYIEELTQTHQLFLAGRARAIRGLQARLAGLPTLPTEYEAPQRNIPAAPAPRTVVSASRTLVPPPQAIAPAVSERPKPATPAAPPSNEPISAPQSPASRETENPPQRRTPRGPSYNRAQLEVLAGGKISEVFGSLFQKQDSFRRQVRLPMPPLLLVDRVTGIDAEPGQSGVGTIWTETDITWDSWYLHQGTMPAGVMIESGQADLLLISWMGADFLNRDQRVYRLLGCEATYFGGLPRPGETLCYEITIDGHARQGDIRLFFFHYDCYVDGKLRLRVRHGQAGFFSEKELAETDGVLWTPDTRDLGAVRVDPPTIACEFTRFTPQQLVDFYAGNMSRCFGTGFENLETHSRTPQIGGPKLAFIEEISQLDIGGGPWKRGYIRAERAIRPDDWYFAGHFLNDPCMPGTLMLEACLQAMSFYVTALGFTSTHDGWQFEPVANETVSMQCRGQVTPKSKHLTIEILVEEVVYDPEPTLFADLLCTVDGVKAFYARRMGLRLVPKWPITSLPPANGDRRGVHRGNLRGDYEAFLECAWGRPSASFGPSYAPFDQYKRTPRLPGPPYHFISRATRIDAEPDHVKPNDEVEVEYDVPADAWYFDSSSQPTMPLAVLMEAALQPCGWLAMMSGVVLKARQELFFRNLDGKCTVYAEVTPQTGTLRTKVRLTRASTVGETTIMFFEMECSVGAVPIAVFETSFGFFTKASLAQQVGVSTRDDEKALMASFRDGSIAATTSTESIGTTIPMLSMSDGLLDYSTTNGRHGLGRICAEQIVSRSAWYFKAHFYQDPVQPGSLGVQALINLLNEWLQRTHGREFAAPHLEPIASNEQMVWTYRGQVVPAAKRVHQCVDLIEIKRDDRGVTAIAEGTLWADGLCIYRISRFAVRITEANSPTPADSATSFTHERIVDPETEPWWKDHSPTYAVPTMPMTGIANELARAAQTVWPAGHVVGICDLKLENWLILPEPVRLQFNSEVISGDPRSGRCEVRVQMRASQRDSASDGKAIATGTVVLAAAYEAAPEKSLSLDNLQELANPYQNASLFHGPLFQLVRRISNRAGRSVVEISLDDCRVPTEIIHPVLLDASLHGIPHSDWTRWIPDVKSGQAGYPVQVDHIEFYGPAPTQGTITAEARLMGGKTKLQTYPIEVQIAVDGRVWAKVVYQERLFPIGAFAKTPLPELRRFIRDRSFIPGLKLSQRTADETRLVVADVSGVNWLPGTVEHIYKITGTANDLALGIAVREHVAGEWSVHPSEVDWDETASRVSLRGNPSQSRLVRVTREGTTVVVRSL